MTQAYEQGKQAYKDKMFTKQIGNPYIKDTPQWIEWNRGWDSAAKYSGLESLIKSKLLKVEPLTYEPKHLINFINIGS